MVALICFVLAVLASPFKSKSRLEAENAVLRHQLIVLQRKVRGRAHLTNNDRWFFVQMYRWFPSILKVVTIIEPETLVRWHRAGFRRYWRVADLSAQSRAGHCRHGFVRCPDYWLQTSLRLRDCAASSQRSRLDRKSVV